MESHCRSLSATFRALFWQFILLLLLASYVGLGQNLSPQSSDYRPGYILVQPKANISTEYLATFHSSHGCKPVRSFDRFHGLQLVQLPPSVPVDQSLATYHASGLVEFAEPDYIGHVFATPNDFFYTNSTQWALHNDGSNGGTP